MLGAGLFLSHGAGAVTMADPGSGPSARSDSAITRVDGGCGGPQFYRAPNGYCYRKPTPSPYYRPPPPPPYYRPAPPPPPPYYARRPCPPGYHPTPYGCRPNW